MIIIPRQWLEAAAGSINRSKGCSPRARGFFTAPLFHSQSEGISAFIYLQKAPLLLLIPLSHFLLTALTFFASFQFHLFLTRRYLKKNLIISLNQYLKLWLNQSQRVHCILNPVKNSWKREKVNFPYSKESLSSKTMEDMLLCLAGKK